MGIRVKPVEVKRLAVPAALLVLAGCGSTTTRTVTATTSAPATPNASSTALPNPTAHAAPVYFEGAVGGGQQRPSSLQLTADGTLSVEQVQWTSWGGPSATGSGSALYHGCTPNCAAAPTHTALVAVRLSDSRSCKGRLYYAGLTLTRSSGRLLDESFVQRSWAPC